MDETGVRALLERVADEPAPPPAIDIAAAREQGRRRLRWHRAAFAAAPLAAAAAVALVVSGVIPASLGLAPGGHGGRSGQRPAVRSSQPVTPRSRFSLLAPYAAFGWLPAHFSAAAGAAMGNTDQTTALSVSVSAADQATDRVLTLTVSAAGACRLTGPVHGAALPAESSHRPVMRTYRHGLSCNYGAGSSGDTPLGSAAPAVSGGRAFYLPGGGLAWEYARGSWAQLVPSVQPPDGTLSAGSARREYQAAAGWVPGRARHGHPAPNQSAATRALLHQVASRVSYGGTAHIVFPFRLPKLPASWAVSTVGYVPAGGRLLATGGLSAGPAVDSGALYVQAQPAGGESTCKIIPGQSYPTRVAGALAEVRTLDEPGKQWQEVCVRDIAGMYLDLSLDGNVPGTSQPLPGQASLGSALSVARRLHLLGTSPAGWTANPVG